MTPAPRIFVLIILIAGAALSPAQCQDASDADAATISRQQWKTRIDEAQRRAGRARAVRRNMPIPEPDAAQQAAERSWRAMQDDSLQVGDIVSTDRGLLRYTGRSSVDAATPTFAPVGQNTVQPK